MNVEQEWLVSIGTQDHAERVLPKRARPETEVGETCMIKLTRLDGQAFILNADLIRYVEARPDTFVTLTSGERIVVGESMDRVVELAVEYQQRKHMIPSLGAGLGFQGAICSE